jgi:hypothetical protein
LEKGQSVEAFITWPDNNGDHGAQSIHGHVAPELGSLGADATLQANNQRKGQDKNGRYTYSALITNIGWSIANFTLQGGGYV